MRATVTHSFTLSNNLTGCPGDGIDIGADNLVIRLGGHSIGGENGPNHFDPSNIGINFDGHNGITLIGGAGNGIEKFATGLLIDGNHNRVQQVLTTGSTIAGVEIKGSYNQLNDSVQEHASVVGGGDGVSAAHPTPYGQSEYGGNTISHDHAIDNPGTGIVLSTDGNTVSYSTVTGNSSGIFIPPEEGSQPHNYSNVVNNVISHNTLIHNTSYGFADLAGSGTTITANIESGSAIGFEFFGCGLDFEACVGPEKVQGNQALDNQFYGYDDGGGVTATFTGNRAEANRSAGFRMRGTETLDHNVAGSVTCTSGGGGGNGIGIELTATVLAGPGPSTITGNSVCNNKGGPDGRGGIVVGPESNLEVGDNTITTNVTSFNAGDGISDGVSEKAYAGPDTLARNVADYNYRYGIEASPSTIDGGGNKASHNDDGQCVNISCH